MGEMRSTYSILVGDPERKRLRGRTWHRWRDNIRLERREIGWVKCGLDASGPWQRLLECSCEHGNKSWGFIKGGEF
jgi:hypothetical protein